MVPVHWSAYLAALQSICSYMNLCHQRCMQGRWNSSKHFGLPKLTSLTYLLNLSQQAKHNLPSQVLQVTSGYLTAKPCLLTVLHLPCWAGSCLMLYPEIGCVCFDQQDNICLCWQDCTAMHATTKSRVREAIRLERCITLVYATDLSCKPIHPWSGCFQTLQHHLSEPLPFSLLYLYTSLHRHVVPSDT